MSPPLTLEKDSRINDCPLSFVCSQNAGSCILTPSCLLGGCPHSLFCHPLHNEGSTYYEDIRVPFKVM